MKKIFYLFIFFWISVVILSFSWHYHKLKKQSIIITYQICRSFFDFVILTREWNALHGGVYAIVTDKTKPNPYLKDPLRDIKIADNLTLTKINPAYMTRQLSDLSEAEKGVKIGIKSLTPLNPENKPDPIEKEALLSFEKGKKEFFKKIGNKYFYMSVLIAAKPCLKCHSEKAKIGSILGGISITLPFIAELPAIPLGIGHFIIGMIGILFIIYSGIKLQTAYEKIKKQAINDGLTGIYNRREFERKFQEEFNRAKRLKKPLTIMLCDIDWFKKYNDFYGHQKGDSCLKEVAKTISRSLKRAVDFCARYGGEEFVIVLPNTDLKGAFEVAEQIRENIKNLHIEHKNSPYNSITLSLGISTAEDFSSISNEDLIKQADEALYKAKNSGRNKIEKF